MSEENTEVNAGPAPEVVREAESQGWVPKEKFRGNEADWVDADTFVKRGREILPILRKNNENLLRDLNATKDQLKEFREAAEEFKKFQRETYERKASEYEKRIAEIKAERAKAISDGDGERVNALDDELDTAKEEVKEAKEAAREAAKVPSAPPQQDSQIDPALQTWLGQNEWFGKDRRLTAIANGVGESLRLEYPDLKGQEFLDKLDEVLREEMPEKFGAKRSVPSNRVESGAGRVGRTGTPARSYENLPPDAKAACDRFVKQKLMTREQYVADFAWE